MVGNIEIVESSQGAEWKWIIRTRGHDRLVGGWGRLFLFWCVGGCGCKATERKNEANEWFRVYSIPDKYKDNGGRCANTKFTRLCTFVPTLVLRQHKFGKKMARRKDTKNASIFRGPAKDCSSKLQIMRYLAWNCVQKTSIWHGVKKDQSPNLAFP